MPNCTNRMSFISLQVLFPEVELILKTFTFAPYCYPYASSKTAVSTQLPTLNFRPATYSNTLASQIHAVVASAITHLPTSMRDNNREGHSNRKISTGKILDAERAGNVVAAMLIANAAAAIHKASNPLA